VRGLAHDDVAGQEHTQLVLDFERFVCDLGVARPKDAVLGHVRADLRLERCLYADVREQAESLDLDGVQRAAQGMRERRGPAQDQASGIGETT
jgi:hypothetical protein